MNQINHMHIVKAQQLHFILLFLLMATGENSEYEQVLVKKQVFPASFGQWPFSR